MSDFFVKELETWGPDGTRRVPTPTLSQAEEYCRRLATSHYENFPLVSLLLPKRLHQHFYNIYAYCRWADDLSDELGNPAQSLTMLQWWQEELNDCYQGLTRHPVFVALRPTIEQFQIPQTPFSDLISAFEQDQRVNEYESFEQLRDYCRRSADPVGRLVLHLIGQPSPQNFAWSDSICTGLQLANFWQDVERDSRIGRIYLPRADRKRFGYSQDDFNERRESPAFLQLMEFQVNRARDWLRAGEPLIAVLPGRFQVDIDLFARGGHRILDRIEKIGYRVWSQRPVVTKWDGLELLLRALMARLWRPFLPRRGSSPRSESEV